MVDGISRRQFMLSSLAAGLVPDWIKGFRQKHSDDGKRLLNCPSKSGFIRIEIQESKTLDFSKYKVIREYDRVPLDSLLYFAQMGIALTDDSSPHLFRTVWLNEWDVVNLGDRYIRAAFYSI